jgi:hypothetical protein
MNRQRFLILMNIFNFNPSTSNPTIMILFRKSILLCSIICLFSSFSSAQFLEVFKSSDPNPANQWTTWENIARPWFISEYSQPFEHMSIMVTNVPYGGTYEIEHNTIRQPETWQWIEDLPTGHYSWFARFEFFNGSIWQWSNFYQGPDFYVDRTPPNGPNVSSGTFPISSFSSLTPWTNRSDLTFTWPNPGDAGSGINHYELSVNDGAWQNVSSGYTPSLTTGTHKYAFRSLDNVGLTSAVNTKYARVDYNPPVCSPNEAFGRASTSPTPAWTNYSSMRLRFNGSDIGSGVKYGYVSVDEGDYSRTINFEAPVSVSDGSHTFDIKVEDEAGNQSSVHRLYARVDTELPTIDFTNPDTDTLISCDSLILFWTGTDQPSGILKYIVDLDDQRIYVGAATSDTLWGLAEGPHQVVAGSVDHAMNYTTETFDFYVDLTAPVITSDHPDLQIPGDDQCFVTMENYIPEVIATDNFSEEIMIIQDPEPGMHIFGPDNEVTLEAWDEAGNHSSVSFNIEVTDTIKPVASFNNDMMVTLDGSCSVAMPDYTDHLALNIIECSSYSVSQAPEPGSAITDTTQVTLTVTDEAGNTDQCSFNVNVIDASGPEITFVTSQEVSLDETCSFILPDYTTDNELTVTDCSFFIVTQQPEAGTTIHDSVTVTLTAADEHGNSTQWNVSVNANDDIDPVIVCVDDQDITLEGDETKYEIAGTALDPVAYMDNCSAVVLTNDLNQSSSLDGEVLELGTTTVTWTATDESGNSATCNFDVTVSSGVGTSVNHSDKVAVYPNPTTGRIFIESDAMIQTVNIMDVTGNIVIQETDAGTRYSINLSDLEAGVYIVLINTTEKVTSHMVIRQ